MANVIFDTPDPIRVLGLSTSHYTGVVDWAKAKANGIRFAIIKAADGLSMGTLYFKENYKGAVDNGILVGAYTWLYKSTSQGGQARAFANYLKDYPLDLPACVDFEWTRSGNPDEGHLYGFVEPFELAYGEKPMIYTAPGYWGQYGRNKPIWATYPLWQAQYNKGQFNPMLPWTQPDFLQWSETGNGDFYGVPKTGEIACELNYWKGTEAELMKTYGKAVINPPIVVPPVTNPPIVVNVPQIKIQIPKGKVSIFIEEI